MDTQLTTVNTDHKSTSWKVVRLRFKLFFHIVTRCLYHVYTLLAFLFLNFIHVAYVILTVSANVAKTILETQQKEQSMPGKLAPASGTSTPFYDTMFKD